MGAIDWILDIVALLLWLNWRSLRFDPLVRTSASSLAGTLRPAETRRGKGWRLLAGVVALLFSRALLYWILGGPVDWTPKLHLGAVVLPFRSDLFGSVLLYSFLGFAKVLVVFYFWLLIIGVFNRGTAEADPVLRLTRLHLGRIIRWPWPLLLVVVPLIVAVLWAALHPLLVWAGILARAQSATHLMQQALLLTLCLVLTLKFVLPLFLLLHFISTYVYLGNNPVWDFISTMAARILVPVRWLPLRFGKIDAAPIVMVAIIFLLLHWVPSLVENKMAQRNIPIWPQ